MSKKRFTPNHLLIGAITFFILCVGGSFLYMQNAKKEAERAKAETQAREQARTEPQQATPAETPVAADPSQGGHVHEDGTYHAEPHAIRSIVGFFDDNPDILRDNPYILNADGTFLIEKLTPERRMEFIERGYRYVYGIDPPPGYAQAEENAFQEHLKSWNKPRVRVEMIRGFKPTRAQLQRYLELEDAILEAQMNGDRAKYWELDAAVDELYKEAEGDVPRIGISGWTSESEFRRILAEERAKVYKEHGLEHLTEAGISALPLLKPSEPYFYDPP